MRSLVVVACIIAGLAIGPVSAADLAPRPPTSTLTPAPAPTLSVRDYVSGRALLHIIRAVFDIEPVEDLADLVAADAAEAKAKGVTEEQARALQVALISEGSYFLTSLRYLVDSGFPNWPQDRSPATYEQDSRLLLQDLPRQLITDVLAGNDPIGLFMTAGEVYWWTEGEKGPFNGRAEFAQRDALVDAALAETVPERASL